MLKLRILILFCILSFTLLLLTSVYAVDVYRISELRGGKQVWFEVEAFDARDTASETVPNVGFKLVDAETTIELPEGAFGDAVVNVSGNDSIWLLYNFDTSEVDGQAGTWYIWCREINPSNQSEFLWVMGDDGDEIPTVKPTFEIDDDRVFDADTGPPWAWDRGNREGERKELREGENTMMIWYRQGNTTALRDVFVWTDNPDYTPADIDYIEAEEIGIEQESVKPTGKLTTTWGEIKGKL